MDFSKKRKNRYLEKLDKIKERCEEIDDWISQDIKFLMEESKDKLAIYKGFQEAVEAITDICAMFLADSNMAVGDDYENIHKSSGKLFPDRLKVELMEANGLRNRVVHEYNKFNDTQALEAVKQLLPSLKRFEKEVREWIKKI